MRGGAPWRPICIGSEAGPTSTAGRPWDLGAGAAGHFRSGSHDQGKTDDKFSVPGTESQRADDLLHRKFPGAGGASARVVFAAPPGETLTDPENGAAAE